jgi:hypothetical protein
MLKRGVLIISQKKKIKNYEIKIKIILVNN